MGFVVHKAVNHMRPGALQPPRLPDIRRLVKPGVPLYNRHLKSSEIRSRIDTYYRPYHQTLEKLIEEAHYLHGHVFHINCHSMPTQEGSAFRASPRCATRPAG